jgi:hypothetical protein
MADFKKNAGVQSCILSRTLSQYVHRQPILRNLTAARPMNVYPPITDGTCCLRGGCPPAQEVPKKYTVVARARRLAGLAWLGTVRSVGCMLLSRLAFFELNKPLPLRNRYGLARYSFLRGRQPQGRSLEILNCFAVPAPEARGTVAIRTRQFQTRQLGLAL